MPRSADGAAEWCRTGRRGLRWTARRRDGRPPGVGRGCCAGLAPRRGDFRDAGLRREPRSGRRHGLPERRGSFHPWRSSGRDRQDGLRRVGPRRDVPRQVGLKQDGQRRAGPGRHGGHRDGRHGDRHGGVRSGPGRSFFVLRAIPNGRAGHRRGQPAAPRRDGHSRDERQPDGHQRERRRSFWDLAPRASRPNGRRGGFRAVPRCATRRDRNLPA